MPEASILITGAGRRVGAFLAKALAPDWHVWLHYNRSQADAQAVLDAITAGGNQGGLVQADLSRPETAPGLIQACQDGPPLRALINNASMFEHDTADSFTKAGFEANMAVHATSPALLAQAFAAQLGGAEGVIVNVLDQKLWNLNPDHFSYTISKYALKGVTEMLALSLAPRVRVNAVAPGLMLPAAGQSDDAFAKAADRNLLQEAIALPEFEAAVRLLLTNRALTGQTLFVDKGQRYVRSPRDTLFQG